MPRPSKTYNRQLVTVRGTFRHKENLVKAALTLIPTRAEAEALTANESTSLAYIQFFHRCTLFNKHVALKVGPLPKTVLTIQLALVQN